MQDRETVLVADDDIHLLRAISRDLRDAGYTCVTAPDGEAALTALREKDFAVALIDLEMPKLDGFEVLAALQHDNLGVVPVVLTGTGDITKTVRSMKLGAYDVLEKPANAALLNAAVDRAATHRRLRDSAKELERKTEAHKAELAKTNAMLRLEEARLEALWQLSQMSEKSLPEIVHFAMEEGVRLTGSSIGYIAFMNEDETVLTMYAWSKTAMEQCAIIDKPIEYPVEKTGLWGEAVRQRKPVITNDYAAPNPLKKGTPEGHVHVTKHMNVPIFDEGRVVVVAGVGNKEGPYDDADVRQLELLMAGMLRIVRQKRAVEEYRSTQEQIARLSSLKERLLAPLGLAEKLTHITDTVVSAFGADFARIWTVGAGDMCDNGCAHAAATEGPHVCADRKHCLHLVASSGRYTHINGPHQRVPIGCCEIGRIASGDEPAFITNDVVHDPRVHNHEWAAELGLVSFAGWRLLSPEGRPIGVLALFSKHPIPETQRHFLEDIANTTSHAILTGLATDALRESESELQAILQGCPAPQFVIDRHHKVISWNKPMEKYTRLSQEQVVGTSEHWRAFYSEPRLCLADLLVDGATDLIQQWYGEKCKPAPLLEGAYVGTDFFPRLGSGGTWLHFTAAPIHDTHGNIIGAIETFEDITERKHVEEELRRSRNDLEMRVAERTQALTQANTSLLSEVERRRLTEEELRTAHGEVERLLASMSSFLIGLRQDLRISRWNAAAETTFGLARDEAVGKCIAECGIRWDWDSIVAQMPGWPTIVKTIRLPDVRYTRADGTEGLLGLTANPVKGDSDVYEGCVLLGTDITERRNLEGQLLHGQKLESVGRLAAGIAHEINTPTQYVGDNIEFLQIAYDSLLGLTRILPPIVLACRRGPISPELQAQAEGLVENTNVDYLTEQVPRAIEQSIEGIGRITTIVQAMKEFSHPGLSEKTTTDLNQCIRSTATVSRNEWKYVADLDLDLDNGLPQVLCFPGDFNQAVLNMIVNAAHAIGDLVGDGAERKGKITVRTRQDGDWVEVRIADTGSGIPEEIRKRVFDPFFTTKEVGKGTGQGLAIAHNVICAKHGGTLTFETETGKGTTFIIRLPVKG